MEEIKPKNLDELKDEIKNEKDEPKQTDWFDRGMKITTLTLALFSIGLSIYTLNHNSTVDKRNFSFQRETQAYNFWLAYLRLAYQEPDMANGKKDIDGIPLNELANPANRIIYPDTSQAKFVKYAWFVANALGAAEVVSSLTTEDNAWIATIDTIIANHISYIRTESFIPEHYSEVIQAEIKKVRNKYKE
jgi:hypothetical protein